MVLLIFATVISIVVFILMGVKLFIEWVLYEYFIAKGFSYEEASELSYIKFKLRR